jgi:hypothetical protein
VNFKSFLFSYFEIPKFSNFFLVISMVFFFFECEGGWGAFALVDFESFLFYYFKVPKFSIFLFVILWVFKKICVKFCKGKKGGICISSCELWKFFSGGRPEGSKHNLKF